MKAKETLFEFYNDSATEEVGYMSSADDDSITPYKKSHTRRPRLTLKHLNKLRNIREQKKTEREVELNHIYNMYRSTSAE